MKRAFPIQFLIVIAAVFLLGLGSVAAYSAAQQAVGVEATSIPQPSNAHILPVSGAAAQQIDNGDLAALDHTYTRIYEQVNPSVVNIQVYGASPNGSTAAQGLGSGFVWDTAGHIVTNYHVIAGASSVSVTFADGSTVDAEVIGTDADADLAVLKVDADAVLLQPVTLADSDDVQVGEIAIAIGNPYGLSGTMTQGIISGLSRSLPVDGETALNGGSYTIPDILQTDAAINPGNSGGVLVNIEGQVTGVTAAIWSTTNANSGIGFVIPSNIVARVVPSLIETGSYQHPRMGLSGTSMDRALAEQLGLDPDQRGVLVASVMPGSPAEGAGLRGSQEGSQSASTGDVIIAIDGQAVKTFDDLTSYLFSHTQVGQTVTLTILRQGQEQTVELTLGVLASS